MQPLCTSNVRESPCALHAWPPAPPSQALDILSCLQGRPGAGHRRACPKQKTRQRLLKLMFPCARECQAALYYGHTCSDGTEPEYVKGNLHWTCQVRKQLNLQPRIYSLTTQHSTPINDQSLGHTRRHGGIVPSLQELFKLKPCTSTP